MSDHIPTQAPPSFETLPLNLEACEEVMNHYQDLQNTLHLQPAGNVAATIGLQERAREDLHSMGMNLGKLQRQHQDCRPGPDGAKHTELGACSVGTMWQPNEPVEMCRLQLERLADLEAKIQTLSGYIRAQQIVIADFERKRTGMWSFGM
ncbi:hypothetical protein LTR36_002302 [Oleoguttula mirabilis]|uniref:Uncharacterized protein n=1 Tax=Oleoguttula mirabilis TaxID=1507867 RepID=A0AAV9JMC9_9PEZI|nr:hypothetical protein LTR36_002302 [Oleoguttula mirabilis]